MANINILSPFIMSYEGGFVNDKDDAGGATNKGVTIATWKKQGYDKDGDGDIDVADLRLISDADAVNIILRPHYWDRWRATEIKSQSIANILVDWVWGSGANGIIIPQRMLGVVPDGIVGEKTISAINNVDARSYFDELRTAREKFFLDCVKSRPANKKFLSGWLRRLHSIQYGVLICNGGKKIKF